MVLPCTSYCIMSSTMSGCTAIDNIKFDNLVKVMMVISLYYKGIYFLQSSVTDLEKGAVLCYHVLPQLIILAPIDDTWIDNYIGDYQIAVF